MADWSDPSPFQLAALHEALLFAYPKPSDFHVFLVLKLGKTYDQLAPPGVNYRAGLLSILETARGDGWLEELVQRARQDKPKSPKLLSLEKNLDLTRVEIPQPLGRNLEDIVRGDSGFKDLIPWVQQLAGLAAMTCRIECPVNTAQGTGWLVGADRLITNWHVIDRALPGGDWNPAEVVCRFDYAVTSGGTTPGIEVRLAGDWCIDASPPSDSELGTGNDAPTGDTLDYAVLKLERPFAQESYSGGETRGWIRLKPEQPLPKPGEIIFVVQHPEGLPVKLAAGDIDSTSADGLRIFHTANTAGGASGSVVLNAGLEPIALHHAGDMRYHRGIIGTPKVNQAIPIGKIAARLIAQGHGV